MSLKIKNIRKSTKEKTPKDYCRYSIILNFLSISLAIGYKVCRTRYFHEPAAFISLDMKKRLDRFNSGFIKVRDEKIPYYYDYIYEKYYFMRMENLYASPQISYNDCYLNVYCDNEVINNFDDNIYNRFEAEYVKHYHFPNTLVNQYEIENLETGEVKNIFGYKVSGTNILILKHFLLKNIRDIIYCIYRGEDLDQPYLTCEEIFELISEIKENRIPL